MYSGTDLKLKNRLSIKQEDGAINIRYKGTVLSMPNRYSNTFDDVIDAVETFAKEHKEFEQLGIKYATDTIGVMDVVVGLKIFSELLNTLYSSPEDNKYSVAIDDDTLVVVEHFSHFSDYMRYIYFVSKDSAEMFMKEVDKAHIHFLIKLNLL